jgi:Glycosyltransferase sugar-binding region containing DXD motif
MTSVHSPDPPPIVQYWNEDPPPDYIAEILATFREHNPYLTHRVFSESTAEALIEEHFGARQVDAFRACAVPAMQADYFRYCAILALGGLYCDVDERCVADLRPLVPRAGGGQLFELLQTGLIVNGLFAFGAPGHTFLELALEIATVNIERRRFQSVFHATGPLVFSCVYWVAKLESFDAMLELAASRPGSRGQMVPTLRAYCEVIGDHARAAPALDGIQVSPFEERTDFVRDAEERPPYKDTEVHYQHWVARGGDIFRSDNRSAR